MPEEQWDRHEHPGLIWAAGAAALALIGVLVFAVVRTSDSAHQPPFVPPPAAVDTTSASAYTASTTSTSYSVPSVQTSQDGDGPAGVPGPPSTSDERSTDDASTTTSTTTSNPYGTTTPTNAGHV